MSDPVPLNQPIDLKDGDRVMYTVMNFHGRNDEIEGTVRFYENSPTIWFIPKGGSIVDGVPVKASEVRKLP